jgi:general secretion pathway protein A
VYYTFFGLKREPFSMSPDPTMLYMTYQHRECIAGLLYSVMHGKGLIVLSGDVGSGKTTILAKLSQLLPPSIRAANISHTTLTPDEFWELLLDEFGLKDRLTGKAQRLIRLREFLIEQRQAGNTVAVIVDEAHKLGIEVLEELRLLSNLEQDNAKLLAIVLAGQLELSDVLRRDDMRQFKQRVAVRLSIRAMQAGDVRPYIQHRWNCAGAIGTQPFTDCAIEAIISHSGCVPRLVNSICDNALLLALAESTKIVEEKQVQEAVADLDLSDSEWRNLSIDRQPVPAKTPVLSQTAAVPAVPVPELQTVVPSLRGVPEFNQLPRQSLFNRWISRMRTA